VSEALREAATLRIGIPMRRGVSSLNLATAVAIVLYAWRFGVAAAHGTQKDGPSEGGPGDNGPGEDAQDDGPSGRGATRP
jgi:hypothetical protein